MSKPSPTHTAEQERAATVRLLRRTAEQSSNATTRAALSVAADSIEAGDQAEFLEPPVKHP